MQSNIDLIMDDLNEFPDSWVELYNPGPDAKQLSDYSLGIKDKISKAYTLPAQTVNAGEYVVIYCDKQNKGLHTSFRLESGKDGAVYLFKGGEITDKLEGLKKQPAPGIAYGRITDGADEWGYHRQATPGTANSGMICSKILGEPIFSHPGSISPEPFSLELSAGADAPENAVIRYTLDGTEPNESSTVYNGAIYVNETTVVRAKLFADGYLSPRSTTHSYIFFPREQTLPIVSMVSDNEYFYGDKIGIFTAANTSWQDIADWRRPMNIEIFMPEEKNSVINQLGETRVKGRMARGNALKSMVIYANKRFGTKRLEYEFFPEDAPGLTDWKSIELRDAGQDYNWLYFRDALVQRMMGRHSDIDWQPYRPAVFMLNGQYMGILNIRSRSNEDHIYTFHGGEEEVDLIESYVSLNEGSMDNFNEFKKFYTQKGHTLEEYSKWMVIDEFADYMIMQLFFDNTDYSGNTIMWRPQADGGKWRWIAKDLDYGLGLFWHSREFPSFKWINHIKFEGDNDGGKATDESRILFLNLMEIPEFNRMFIDRCAVYMGDFLHKKIFYKYIDEMNDAIAEEYIIHRQHLGLEEFDRPEHTKFVKWWFDGRRTFFYDHIAEFFELGTPRRITIDAGRSDDIKLTINGVPLRYRDFDGSYFEDKDLNIEGVCPEGLQVAGWNVTVTKDGKQTTTRFDTPTLNLKIPECESVAIQSLTAISALDEISFSPDETSGHSGYREYFDLSGRKVGHANADTPDPQLVPGIYIVRFADKTSAKVIIK
ncbi:MAG: hypothetical protein HDS01_09880 [Bacteroides sp.]|nr:hypothetical protein [Bacteroides sp.]